MPQEIRKIIFSPSEVLEALDERGGNGSALPDASLDFQLDQNGRVLRIEHLSGGEDAAPKTSQRDATEVGAALIKHCLDGGIPIPRGAKRSLDIYDGKLTLILSIGETLEAPKLDLPDFYEYDFFE